MQLVADALQAAPSAFTGLEQILLTVLGIVAALAPILGPWLHSKGYDKARDELDTVAVNAARDAQVIKAFRQALEANPEAAELALDHAEKSGADAHPAVIALAAAVGGPDPTPPSKTGG